MKSCQFLSIKSHGQNLWKSHNIIKQEDLWAGFPFLFPNLKACQAVSPSCPLARSPRAVLWLSMLGLKMELCNKYSISFQSKPHW